MKQNPTPGLGMIIDFDVLSAQEISSGNHLFAV